VIPLVSSDIIPFLISCAAAVRVLAVFSDIGGCQYPERKRFLFRLPVAVKIGLKYFRVRVMRVMCCPLGQNNVKDRPLTVIIPSSKRFLLITILYHE